MRARTIATALLFTALAVVGARPGFAVNVPGDYPTIQAALDSGATEVFVADGTYHEVVRVSNAYHDVTLAAQAPLPGQPAPRPSVDGMIIQPGAPGTYYGKIIVQGIHFTGPVVGESVPGSLYDPHQLDSCQLDAGLALSDGSNISAVTVHDCRVKGDVYLRFGRLSMRHNVVEGGSIKVIAYMGGGSVTGNQVVGPAPTGITTMGDDSPIALGNTVRNCQVGIMALGDYADIDSNLVEDCSGSAYVTSHGGPLYPMEITNNVARRCGGFGIDVDGRSGAIRDNTIDSVGLGGIHIASESLAGVRGNSVAHCGGIGVWCEGTVLTLLGNTVRHAGGDGILATQLVGPVVGNVTGRCRGRGLAVSFDSRLGGPLQVAQNTSYSNEGAGLEVIGDAGGAADSIMRNLAYGNSGPGLRWSGAPVPVLGCDDWYANAAGATDGINPAVTDLAVDPRFCDLAHDVVSLSAGSPLVDAPGCGPIGALGVGCTQRANHSPDCSQATVSPADLWPPDHGLVAIAIGGVTDPDGDPVTITVTGITQDESLEAMGEGADCADAAIVDGVARVRAERAGGGNGRVYTIAFTASDGTGGSCDGAVDVCVPHDQGRHRACVKDGVTVNSLGRCGRTVAKPGLVAGVPGAPVRVRGVGAARVTLEYTVPAEGDVQLAMYDVAGRRVGVLADARQSPGTHVVDWERTGVARGVYFYRLRTTTGTTSGLVIVPR